MVGNKEMQYFGKKCFPKISKAFDPFVGLEINP